MRNPFNRVLTALSYMKGPLVEDWVNSRDHQLAQCLLNPAHANFISDTSESLWDEFKATFKSAWKNGKKVQSAYEQLMKLSMKELDIGSYTATFERLSTATGWEPDVQGTINKFRRGLKDNIHRRVINWDKELSTMDEWKGAN